MANKRVFYAVQQIGFAPIGTQTFTAAHGVQSVGITTNFNLEQVFELGQLAIYENIENIPDIEMTVEKVLDGYPLIYHLATNGASTASLAGRSVVSTVGAMSVFGDTQDSASGTPIAEVQMSGLLVSSVSYTFPVDGNFTESVTLVGNNKVWKTSGFTFNGAFNNADEPFALLDASGGVNRREDLLFDYAGSTGNLDVNGTLDLNTCTLLPQDIDGISASGTNDRNSVGDYSAHVQNITASTDLGREELFELGRRAPYHRFVTFPTEVTCEIETIGVQYDKVSATEAGVLSSGNNLGNRTIKIRTREGTLLDLGKKNKLASVSWGGGDAGGGNVAVTYSYTTFNDFVVKHRNDITAALRI